MKIQNNDNKDVWKNNNGNKKNILENKRYCSKLVDVMYYIYKKYSNIFVYDSFLLNSLEKIITDLLIIILFRLLNIFTSTKSWIYNVYII